MSKIITIPHPTLRSVAQPVTVVDKKLKNFIADLQSTLAEKRNPRGVGLAAPQIDTRWRIFATQLPLNGVEDENEDTAAYHLRTFINPRILDHSDEQVFGPDKKHSRLEGCLSIPGIYGPVPRWREIKLEFQTIEGNELTTHTEIFADFPARVVQHEEDHLNGILFIDYTQEYELPLYQEDKKTDKLYDIEPEMIAALVESSK